MTYPAKHFPGTPKFVQEAVERAIERTGVKKPVWQVPLEVIARYESDCNPDPSVMPGSTLRGMMQQSTYQYRAALNGGYIKRVRYEDPEQAVVVAIRYIQGKLVGFGGYGGMARLLLRDDRGPGDVLLAWGAAPASSYAALRRFYHGY